MTQTATRQNLAASTLTGRQEKAALLVAEDEKTNEQIAVECGVKRQTLDLWKKRDDFKARVAEHVEAFKNAALTIGFADRRARLQALNGLAQDLIRDMADPGDDIRPSGMYRKEIKIAAGVEAVDQLVFDKPKVDTFRGLLDDIAKELGERRAGLDVKHTFDRRREAEAIAAEIGKGDDPAVVAQIEQDLLVSQEPMR